MIPHTNQNSQQDFMHQVDSYNKKVKWEKDDKSLTNLKNFVSSNLDKIKNCVEINTNNINSAQCREELAAFAERIKTEFPGNTEAAKVANDINSYVTNACLAEMPDPFKDIFSSLIPKGYASKPKSGFHEEGHEIGTVSKYFHDISGQAEQQWVQENLISLKIYGLKTPEDVIKYIVDHRLTRINLSDFPDFNETHLRDLVKRLSELEHPVGITHLKIGKFEKIAEWPMMPSLISISPSFIGIDDKEVKAFASKCPSLQIIFVPYSKITDEGLREISQNCHDLRDIHLNGVLVTDIGVKMLSENCTKLELVSLNGTINKPSQVTDEGLDSLLKNCQNLQTLNVSASNVTGEKLKNLSKKRPKLRYAYFDNSKLTDEGLKNISIRCPNLQVVEVQGTQIGDDGLKELSKNCQDSLQVIYLFGTNATNEGMKDLSKCHDLREVRCFRTDISYEGVKVLLENCPKMERVVALLNTTDQEALKLINSNVHIS